MSTSTFVCDSCGTLDSIYATQQTGGGYTCHQCKHGYWHDQFPKEQYDPTIHHDVLNRVSMGDEDEHPSFS